MKKLIQALALIVAILLLAAILYVSFAPKGSNLPSLPPLLSDKVNHIAGTYVLTLLSLAAVPKLRPLWAAAMIILAGGAIELAQEQFGREASLGDFLANAAGVLLAVIPLWLARLRDRGPG